MATNSGKLSILLAGLLVTLAGLARAQAADLSQLTEISGKIDQFTLSSTGAADGFLLDDGTEVHVASYLAKQLTAAVSRGEPVKVRGYRATGAPFMVAVTVRSMLSKKSVEDKGRPTAAPATPAAIDDSSLTTVEGTVKTPLHGLRGQVNGAILQGGQMLRLPEHVAADYPDLFTAGQAIAARGEAHATEYGQVLRVESLGPSASQLTPVAPGYQPPPRPASVP